MYDKKYKEAYLAHYNHNHDALGRFARSGGVSKSEKSLKKLTKKTNNNDANFVREYAHTAASERMKWSNIRRSDEDVNEIALNKVVNKNINVSNKNVKKYLDTYYNKGFDPNNEKDRIKMGKYYAEIKLAQINIERANQMNEANGRGRLAESSKITDPLDTRTSIPQSWSYKTTKDIKRDQKSRNQTDQYTFTGYTAKDAVKHDKPHKLSANVSNEFGEISGKMNSKQLTSPSFGRIHDSGKKYATDELYTHYKEHPEFYRADNNLTKDQFKKHVILDQVNYSPHDNTYHLWYIDDFGDYSYPDNTWYVVYDNKKKVIDKRNSQYYR